MRGLLVPLAVICGIISIVILVDVAVHLELRGNVSLFGLGVGSLFAAISTICAHYATKKP